MKFRFFFLVNTLILKYINKEGLQEKRKENKQKSKNSRMMDKTKKYKIFGFILDEDNLVYLLVTYKKVLSYLNGGRDIEGE